MVYILTLKVNKESARLNGRGATVRRTPNERVMAVKERLRELRGREKYLGGNVGRTGEWMQQGYSGDRNLRGRPDME